MQKKRNWKKAQEYLFNRNNFLTVTLFQSNNNELKTGWKLNRTDNFIVWKKTEETHEMLRNEIVLLEGKRVWVPSAATCSVHCTPTVANNSWRKNCLQKFLGVSECDTNKFVVGSVFFCFFFVPFTFRLFASQSQFSFL